jgi:hypothetical protein
MTTWTTMPSSDVREFLARKGAKRVQEHAFKLRKRIPWPICAHCGLLALRNDRTRKAMREKCVSYE